MPQVYVVKNMVNGKFYIGYTRFTFEVRWRQHLNAANKGYPTYFINAIRKHGPQAFRLVALISSASPESGKSDEQALIKEFDSTNPMKGYNLTAGGEGLVDPTPEVRIKISEAGMGRKPSEETRRIISARAMGNQRWLGRKHSAETKIKMSAASKGRIGRKGPLDLSPEQIEKKRVRMLGNKLNLGKKDSDGVRLRKKAAARLVWANRKIACREISSGV